MPPLPFTLWVDADGLPRAVRDVLVRSAAKREVRAVLVANRYLERPITKFVDVVQVPAGDDRADDYIAARATPRDLVVTDDVPLAARAVEAGADVLQFRGRLLDKSNVREVLSVRDFAAVLREMGVETGGPKAWRAQDKNAFANALDRWLARAKADAERRARVAARATHATQCEDDPSRAGG